ncbi:MAG: MBL fold metallo-hydrolase [Candidatus Bathyarchaeota archaeon]|nr:MBL fold metallo-hydrolase [Candidatus Bathyarchaeum tardum]WGM89496.1 MAG: MBL fold metallo-hydrolase [Candidatus Bathyarchaeum tardum]WNZ28231.1 MAG: MBL fold metallo-hydrolase [Candidatus Bathyarchaeota archaeon]
MEGAELVFLGTGGGRFVTITQKRRTGGFRLLTQTENIHVDPGPGALIYSLESGLNPQKLKAVLISHRHPDHYANAEVLVESMTRGMLKKRGTLAAPTNILAGDSQAGPPISLYHQKMIKQTVSVKPGVNFKVGNIKIVTTQTKHTDPETVGFKFDIPEVGTIGYTADTEYFEEIKEEYKGVKLLILSVMRPNGSPWTGHMTPKEAALIAEAVKPEMVVATHFGLKMIYSGPAYEIKYIEQKTGVPAVAAFDGMKLKIGKKITIGKLNRPQQNIEDFLKRQTK